MFNRVLPDEAAAIAAFLSNGGKVSKVEAGTPRSDLKLGKITQGYTFKSLRDRPEPRPTNRPRARWEVTGVNYLHTHGKP